MAYMTSEMKKELAPGIRSVLKKYNVKGTIAVRNSMVLLVNIKSSAIDFLVDTTRDNDTVNDHYIKEHYSGVAKDFLLELREAMMTGNHNNSDIMSDYFDVGWYININIGRWDKPYELTN